VQKYPSRAYILGEPYGEYRIPLKQRIRALVYAVLALGLGILWVGVSLNALLNDGNMLLVLLCPLGIAGTGIGLYVLRAQIRLVGTLLLVAPNGLIQVRGAQAVDVFPWDELQIMAVTPQVYMVTHIDGARFAHMVDHDNRVSDAIVRKYRVQQGSHFPD